MLKVYKASAGSGKTYTLTQEYLRMMLHDYARTHDAALSYRSILAVTFTKKATAEMKQRILMELSHRAQQGDLPSQQLLHAILQDYSRFNVSTIDSFFQQIVRQFAFDLNLPSSYEISLDGEEIITRAVDDLFRRIRTQPSESDLTSWLTEFSLHNIADNQYWNPHRAISQIAPQLLQENLMRHMAELKAFFADKSTLHTYLQQMQSLVQDRENRLNRLLRSGRHLIQGVECISSWVISTFQSDAETLLIDGVGSRFSKLPSEPESFYVKSKVTDPAAKTQLQSLCHQLLPTVEQILILCSDTRDYITAKLILDNLFSIGVLQDVASQVEETNRQLSRLPSTDINLLIHDIIDGQDAPFIYERIGQRYRHFMMDEFQDTSTLQWDNFAPLIRESLSQGHDNLIVGDVKQSIYRWRNSDWKLLEHIPHEFDNCTLPSMGHNWRTSPLVVQQNEDLMRRYREWVVQTLQADFPDHGADMAQSVQTIYAPDQIHQEPHQNYPGVFHLQFFDRDKPSSEDYLDYLPPLLNQLQQEGFTPNRIAFLVRRGDDAQALSAYLVNHGCSVQSAEGLLVSAHPAVQLLTLLLSRTLDPDNEIIAAQIALLHPEWTEEENTAIDQARLQPLYEQIQTLITSLQLTRMQDAEAYLTAFQDQVYTFTQNRAADLQTFLEWWNRRADKITIPASDDKQSYPILTIHKSKGLEYDVVIIPWLNWTLTAPSNRPGILWCHTHHAPFDALPIVGIDVSKTMLQSHFQSDYEQEIVARYLDNMNLTYVAFTRPRYRLYAFGEYKTKSSKMDNIAKLLHHVYQSDLDADDTYHVESPGTIPVSEPQAPAPTLPYIHEPLHNRLILRSRSEDDFSDSADISTRQEGICMHDFLSQIQTLDQTEPLLHDLLTRGDITPSQSERMRSWMKSLQQLLTQTNHLNWFDGSYRILSERDILLPDAPQCRPDRVMIDGNRAIVIDYKFGTEHKKQYFDQVRHYMNLLSQMGYQVEGWLVYPALHKIESVQ